VCFSVKLRVLQCAAVCCSVLQCFAVCCRLLHLSRVEQKSTSDIVLNLNAEDALSLWVIFHKRALFLAALLQKETILS